MHTRSVSSASRKVAKVFISAYTQYITTIHHATPFVNRDYVTLPRIRGDTSETYKILTGKYDTVAAPN